MGTHNRTHTTTTTQDLYKMATTQGQTTLGKEVAVHDIFQKTLDKTGHWLKDIKNECNLADVHQAYTLLRAVLFTIRDRAPMMDSIHFAAQLPMLVRGFFFEGWIPYDTPDKDIRTKQNFFDTVTLHVGNKPGPLTEDIVAQDHGCTQSNQQVRPQPRDEEARERHAPQHQGALLSSSPSPHLRPNHHPGQRLTCISTLLEFRQVNYMSRILE